MKNKLCKRLYGTLCVLLCAVFIFSFTGCSDDIDDDAQNALLSLLNNYHQSYLLYQSANDFIDNYIDTMYEPVTNLNPALIFAHNDEAILTGDDIVFTELIYQNNRYSIKIQFTQSGIQTFNEFAEMHMYEQIDIILSLGEEHIILWAGDIMHKITDDVIASFGSFKTEEAAKEIQTEMACGYINNTLPKTAKAYNDMRTLYKSSRKFLPELLSTEAPFTDVSTYIDIALQQGFSL